jgi:hypothetical protein
MTGDGCGVTLSHSQRDLCYTLPTSQDTTIRVINPHQSQTFSPNPHQSQTLFLRKCSGVEEDDDDRMAQEMTPLGSMTLTTMNPPKGNPSD